MKKKFIYLFVAILAVVTITSQAQVKQMTMKTALSSVDVLIMMAGSGSCTIDWGDGSEIETKQLHPHSYGTVNFSPQECSYLHNYPDTTERTIIITGENITLLDCRGIVISSLDVSRNTALQYLDLLSGIITIDEGKININSSSGLLTSLDISKNIKLKRLNCTNNLLTSIDVSNNKALNALYCNGNQLTNLDISNNVILTLLYCAGNQITSLDVSKNTRLTDLSCGNNKLDASALNSLFGTLHRNRGKKSIYLDNSSETESSDKRIATNKRWTVLNEEIWKLGIFGL